MQWSHRNKPQRGLLKMIVRDGKLIDESQLNSTIGGD
jgi:hypothetical protein